MNTIDRGAPTRRGVRWQERPSWPSVQCRRWPTSADRCAWPCRPPRNPEGQPRPSEPQPSGPLDSNPPVRRAGGEPDDFFGGKLDPCTKSTTTHRLAASNLGKNGPYGPQAGPLGEPGRSAPRHANPPARRSHEARSIFPDEWPTLVKNRQAGTDSMPGSLARRDLMAFGPGPRVAPGRPGQGVRP